MIRGRTAMKPSGDELLSAVLSSGTSDVVAASTDDTFDKAIELEADSFGKLFHGRASSHIGFSTRIARQPDEDE